MNRSRAYQKGPDVPIYRARIKFADGREIVAGPYATRQPARAQANSWAKRADVVESVVETIAGPWEVVP